LVAKFLSYRKAPNAEAADKAIRLCNSAGFNPKQWTVLLNELARKKQATWAMLVLDWMACNGAEPNVIHYNCVISSCEKAGQWEKALALLQEVKVRKGIEPDEYTYNAAISACEKGGQWEQALALLAEVKERQGIEPDEITYNATLDAVSGQFLLARTLYLEAVDLKIYQPPNDRTAQLWKFDLHDHSEGAAITAARWWIETEVTPWHFGDDTSPDVSLELITGYGKTREVWRKGELSGGDIKAAVMELLVDMEVPIDKTNRNPGRLAIDRSRWHPQEEPTSSTE
jgi:pentatricopeptide repeat protein